MGKFDGAYIVHGVFIKWTGKIVYRGDEITVNAIGVGEFTRAGKHG